MSYSIGLTNLDDIVEAGTPLGYHLHSTWDNAVSSSTSVCGPDATGGHYDPTYMCGPASEANSSNQCKNANYQCSTDQPNKCERGDLSGKFGNLIVQADFTASTSVPEDKQGAKIQE